MLQFPSPVIEIEDELTQKAGIRLLVKRDDLIHPLLSGNKWRKLKYNLEEAHSQEHHTLLTFGGAYSNHLHATAAAGALLGFKTIGVVRGEESLPLNPTLQFATQQGMQLEHMDRQTYRMKDSEEVLQVLKAKYGPFYHIPEGGANQLGVKGCSELVTEISLPFDFICCACGTGTTLAGIASALPPGSQAIGFSALKGGDFLKESINSWLAGPSDRFYIETDYHFGGYAQTTPELWDFIEAFEKQHPFLLEQVYTGKMFYGLYDLMKKGFFSPGQTVIALHTGGLQGRKPASGTL